MADDDVLADERLIKRRQGPLAPKTILRFQRITAAKNPAKNYWYELDEDGAVRLARHSGDTDDWQTPLDVDLPTAANAKARGGVLRKLRKLLAREHITELPAVVAGPPTKDGTYEVVTARTDDGDKEVVFASADNDLLHLLRDIAKGVD